MTEVSVPLVPGRPTRLSNRDRARSDRQIPNGPIRRKHHQQTWNIAAKYVISSAAAVVISGNAGSGPRNGRLDRVHLWVCSSCGLGRPADLPAPAL